MAGLAEIERRIEQALARLQGLAQTDGADRPSIDSERLDAERAEWSDRVQHLDQECEVLREECDRLRRELEASAQRRQRLEEALATAEVRLGAAMADLDELLEE